MRRGRRGLDEVLLNLANTSSRLVPLSRIDSRAIIDLLRGSVMMGDDFDWIQPRHLMRTANAIAYAESKPERIQFVRVFVKGLARWAVVVVAVMGVSTSIFIVNKSSPWMMAAPFAGQFRIRCSVTNKLRID